MHEELNNHTTLGMTWIIVLRSHHKPRCSVEIHVKEMSSMLSHKRPKYVFPKAMSYKLNKNSSGGIDTLIGSLSWLIHVLAVGKKLFCALVKIKDGAISNPRTGSSSDPVVNLKMSAREIPPSCLRPPVIRGNVSTTKLHLEVCYIHGLLILDFQPMA